MPEANKSPTQSTSATRQDLDGISLRRETVPAPEIGPGKFIIVQQPDGDTSELLEIQDWPRGKDGMLHLERKGRDVRWIIACVVDENGKPLYADEDAAVIGRMPGSLRQRIAAKARDLDSAKLKDSAVDTAAGNSSGDQGSSSPTV